MLRIIFPLLHLHRAEALQDLVPPQTMPGLVWAFRKVPIMMNGDRFEDSADLFFI